MFTGIIRKTARVTKAERDSTGMMLFVSKSKLSVKKGDSIAVNGVCSTVVTTGAVLGFQYMPETLERTAVGELKAGEIVNLEPSLRASDRLDGHIVLGHVDTVGKVTAISAEGNSKVFSIEPCDPKKFMKFVAEKGSVALDGVSLTVTKVTQSGFEVKLIPYTLENTSFKNKKTGSFINVEFDILAKYLERLR
ncbi:MAG: riboflavin synthase subunit alpha [Parcubacteria group bacterium GW2011_GWA2_47_16]|nr:MAG: riboflavin synthase subunit alpha [Parcubacteria group bacterium GW2011_GWA2_47_16]